MLSLIAERRRDGADRGDLLSMLLAARDEETGEGLDDQPAARRGDDAAAGGPRDDRDGAVVDVLPVVAAPGRRGARWSRSWTRRCAAGAAAAPRTCAPRYTRMVLDESLRLYPPAWVVDAFGRRGPTRSAASRSRAGSRVLVEPVRHAARSRLWDDPEGFDPERFCARARGRGGPPRYAYFPFGGGPHLCIGAGFAMMEATIVLATVARRLRLDLEPGRPVAIDPLVTLRPTPGIWMTARAALTASRVDFTPRRDPCEAAAMKLTDYLRDARSSRDAMRRRGLHHPRHRRGRAGGAVGGNLFPRRSCSPCGRRARRRTAGSGPR